MHKLVKKKINKMISGGSFNGAPALTNLDAIKPQVPLTAMGLGKNPIGKLEDKGPTAFDPISDEDSPFASAVGTIGNLASLGNKLFSNKNDSALTKGLDSAYDAAANAASMFGPIGTMVGGFMKIGGFANSALKSAGIGTDQLTGTDKILGSNFLALTPVGLANSLGASKLLKFTKDNDTINQVGNAYGGALSDINTAEKYSGKKVGLFSNSGKYNSKIANANLEQYKMSGIAGTASDRFTNANNQLIGLGNILQQSGGYNQSGTTFGKNGLKLQDGGTISPNASRIKQIVDYINSQRGTVNWVKRLNEPTLRTIPMRGGDVGSHMLGYGEDDHGIFIFPGIQEINGKLINLSETKDGGMGSAIAHHDVVYVPNMTSKEAEWFTDNNYKNYWGNIKKYAPIRQKPEVSQNDAIQAERPILPIKHKDGGTLEFAKRVLSMKSGGPVNVIPVGALHKNLHHLEDIDDKYKEVTTKGIPIITEGGGELQQQAEVEKEEIIFNLDVTKKLEELRERGTDEAAIAAGKLLTKEILENTVDKAGLIKTVE